MKRKILFVCVHNSARSQMAEAFLNKHGSDQFEGFSAGIEPGTLNPLVVEVMAEKGIDISQNKAKSAFDLFKQGKLFSYVVTVCDKEAAQRCPIFPGVRQRIMMSFKDPSSFEGTYEQKIQQTRAVRDEIENEVLDLIHYLQSGNVEENFKQNWELG